MASLPELGSLFAISNSAPTFGEIEGDDSKALFDTGGITLWRLLETACTRSRARLFDTVTARNEPAPFVFDTACSTLEAPLSTTLVVLNAMSVGDK